MAVKSEQLAPEASIDLAGELGAAFRTNTQKNGHRWRPKIVAARRAAGGVRIDLEHDDALMLCDVLCERWLGTGAAAQILDVEPSTIRSWVTRGGPKSHPFPRPDRQASRRNYWRPTTIRRWQDEERRQREERRRRAQTITNSA